MMIEKRSKSVSGFTVVELLVTLVISGIVMAVVASAISASSTNYKANEEMFKAMNTSRLVLLKITSEIRTAQAVAVDETDTECSIVTTEGRDITYSYNAAEKTLYLITNDDLSDDDYVMCENISDLTFTRRTLPSDADKIKDVKISLTMTIGDTTQTISSAAVVRNNLF